MSDDFDGDSYRTVRDMAMSMKERGARLITVVGRDLGDGNIELVYLFDEGGKILDHRYVVEAEREVDSISDIYAGATNMERENIDLLGMRFKGLQPGLLLVPGKSVEAPLRKRPEET